MKYLMHFLHIFFALSFISCNELQMEAELKIKIVDKQNFGLPEVGVKISSLDTTMNVKSDFKGTITIKGIKTGLYQLSTSAVGYFNLSDYPIKVMKNETMIEIEMERLGLVTDSVEWSGGWVTLEDKKGKIISVRSKNKK